MNRFNPYEGYVDSESVGQDILLAGRAAMNRALDGDIVAVELLPEEQWSSASTQLRKHDDAEAPTDEVPLVPVADPAPLGCTLMFIHRVVICTGAALGQARDA